MTLLSDKPALLDAHAALPQEVDFILSALEAAEFAAGNRRKERRVPYRVAASLKLFSDTPQAPPWKLYIRDICPRGLGFVTRHRMPLGYGGILSIIGPTGKSLKIDCTLLRCREAISGWFEGGIYFNREQGEFDLKGFKSVTGAT